MMKFRTKVQAREYTLEITDGSEENFEFKLKLTVSGHFGSLGNEWIGSCSIEDNRIMFKTREHVDWRYTFLDDERDDMVSDHNKTYTGEVFIEENDIKLVIAMETLTLYMHKVYGPINIYTHGFTREIIKNFNLDDKPGWKISNLIFRHLKEHPDTGEVELFCDYDLDALKEEKGVIKSDEIVREHHTDRIVFNDKHKIIKTENIN